MPAKFEPIPEFTTGEIQDAMNRLERGKAGDSGGIRAEQIKICGDEAKEKTRQIFNKVMLQDDCTPKT